MAENAGLLVADLIILAAVIVVTYCAWILNPARMQREADREIAKLINEAVLAYRAEKDEPKP